MASYVGGVILITLGMIITLPLAVPTPKVPVQVALAKTEELIQLKIPRPRALVDKIQL